MWLKKIKFICKIFYCEIVELKIKKMLNNGIQIGMILSSTLIFYPNILLT